MKIDNMAYNKEEIFNKALEISGDKNCHFIQDVIAYLPCNTSTFYEFFPAESEQMETIKENLTINKVKEKMKLRKDFSQSDNSTQKALLYKLLATDEERKALSQQYVDHTSKGDKFNITWHESIEPENNDGE